MTREQYLHELIAAARPLFGSVGAKVPDNVRVSIGLPRSRKAVGECWQSVCSADKGREIWISPVLTDPLRIAGVLVHELCHSALPDDVAHKAPFVKLARRMHLEGKPTATTEGEAFFAVWKPIVADLGNYPGVAFDPHAMPKRQGTRMIKAACKECGFTFRTTRKWLDRAPSLRCPRDLCLGTVDIEDK